MTRKLEYIFKDFESECFKNRTFEILGWEADGFEPAFAQMLSAEKLGSGDLVYIRIPSDDIAAIHAAERTGFYFVECTIIPTISLRSWKRDQFERYIWPTVMVGTDLIDEVERIAFSTFKGLRFNLDPHIDNAKANERYRRWLRKAYEDGEDIQAILYKNKVAGFSFLRYEENDKVIWTLAGVNPDLGNAGLGVNLYASIIAYCIDRGAKRIDGGISVFNTPVLNVMSNLGFSFITPTVVLHYFVR